MIIFKRKFEVIQKRLILNFSSKSRQKYFQNLLSALSGVVSKE